MIFCVRLVAKRVGRRTNWITLSLTWVCFSLWVLNCFKFQGLVFSCGFDDFSGLEVSGLDIFSGWFFHLDLVISSCERFWCRIEILYEFVHVYLLRKYKKREYNLRLF